MSISSVQHSVNTPVKEETKKQEANKSQVNSVLAVEEENSWLGDKLRSVGFDDTADWLEDKDKKCTDGKDDGKISLTDKAIGFGKGLVSIVKVVAKNPIATIGTAAVGIGLTALTGGAILPALVAAGTAVGTGMVGYGAYKAATAETDAEAKQAWETLGEGTLAVVTSVLGAKTAVNTAGKAGVTASIGCEDMTTAQALKHCIKTTPESLKVGYSNAVRNAKVLLGSAQPAALTAQQAFEHEKIALKNKMAVNLERTLTDSEGLAIPAYYKDIKSQQAVMDLVDENNIDLAKALFKTTEQIASQRNSSYAVGKEQVCEYYLETIPKILKSNNKELQDVAMYIANSDDIVDKFYALKVLNSENAQQIRALQPYIYQSQEQVVSGSSGLFGSKNDGVQTVNKTMSIDRQIWDKYTPNQSAPELLPHLATSTSLEGQPYSNQFRVQYFTPRGTVPNVPGSYPIKVQVGKEEYLRYVFHEEVVPSSDVTGVAMQRARELLNQYGTRPEN